MKRLMNILLVAGLTAGVANCAEAQRSRNGGESSRGGGGRETNVSARGARGGGGFSGPNVSEARNNRGNFGNSQRVERQVAPSRQSTFRNTQPRNEVVRSVERNNSVGRVNRGPVQRFNRGNNSRYNNSYGYNRYNNGYRNNNGFYRTGYNRGFHYAYGPRYSIIPRNHVSIYFGGNPYYYYNGFYYGYYGGYYNPIFPPIGLRVGFLPFGCSSLFIGGFPYYYGNGIYYRQYDDNNYEVVDSPMGATVSSLPKGAKSVNLNGEKMYELNGTYYKEDQNSKGEVIYTVVGKNGEINNSDNGDNNAPGNNDVTTPPASLQMGDVVNQLPEGSRTVTISGEKMYVAPDDTYLKEESNGGGAVQYRVVGIGKE
ncbi:MAG: DUF6515 family protein [Ginsengibacter sp.]